MAHYPLHLEDKKLSAVTNPLFLPVCRSEEKQHTVCLPEGGYHHALCLPERTGDSSNYSAKQQAFRWVRRIEPVTSVIKQIIVKARDTLGRETNKIF